jgi:hypothetical protein
MAFTALGPGRLRQSTVAQTPDDAFNGDPDVGGSSAPALAQWINDNQAALIGGTATVPPFLPADPTRAFLGMASPNMADPGLHRSEYWAAPGIVSNEARHMMSQNSCNGCHGRETHQGLSFVQTGSAFLTGETVTDPVDGTSRTFNDLLRRAQRLEEIASASCRLFVEPDRPVAERSLPFPPLAFSPTLDAD